MSKAALPSDVRRFLLTSVPSVPYLEAMLLMRGESGESWNADKMARRLYVRKSDAAQLLLALEGAGVTRAVKKHDFVYAPSAELGQMIDALAFFYPPNLMEIAAMIHSRTDRHAMQFADAFRLKKPGG